MCDESSRDQSLVVDHRSPAQYGGEMSSSVMGHLTSTAVSIDQTNMG